MNYKIHVYDPIEEAVQNTKQLFEDKIVYHDTPEQCAKSSKLCILINPNKNYAQLIDWIEEDGFVIDCWRSIKQKSKKIVYVGIK